MLVFDDDGVELGLILQVARPSTSACAFLGQRDLGRPPDPVLGAGLVLARIGGNEGLSIATPVWVV